MSPQQSNYPLFGEVNILEIEATSPHDSKKETNAMQTETEKPMHDTAPTLADTLWTVKDAAAFLRKSPRWIFYALQTPETEEGSIPHSKLGRNPRFIPADIRTWAAQGFPPAATFRAWKEADAKRVRRN